MGQLSARSHQHVEKNVNKSKTERNLKNNQNTNFTRFARVFYVLFYFQISPSFVFVYVFLHFEFRRVSARGHQHVEKRKQKQNGAKFENEPNHKLYSLRSWILCFGLISYFAPFCFCLRFSTFWWVSARGHRPVQKRKQKQNGAKFENGPKHKRGFNDTKFILPFLFLFA